MQVKILKFSKNTFFFLQLLKTDFELYVYIKEISHFKNHTILFTMMYDVVGNKISGKNNLYWMNSSFL